MKSIEQHFADWEAHTFGFGYGTGEQYTVSALKAFFEAFGHNGRPGSYDYRHLEAALGPRTAWLLINILCHANIIEYGSSPRYGWLTEQGAALKKFVDSKSASELLDTTDTADDYHHCFPEGCNCGSSYREGKNPCGNPFF